MLILAPAASSSRVALRARKVTALIAIPNRGRALLQGLTDRIQHKRLFERIVKRPTDNVAGVQIQHRHQIHPPRCQADIRDINRPDMIRLAGRDAPQQVRIDAMLASAAAQIWPWADPDDAHLAHVPLHGFAIDDQLVVARQDDFDPPRPIGGLIGVNLINRVFDGDLCGRRRDRLIVQAASAEAEQVGLDSQRDSAEQAVDALQPLSS